MYIIHSATDCAKCKMVQMILDKNQIEYQKVDLDSNPDLVENFRKDGQRDLPVITKDGDYLSFNELIAEIRNR